MAHTCGSEYVDFDAKSRIIMMCFTYRMGFAVYVKENCACRWHYEGKTRSSNLIKSSVLNSGGKEGQVL